MDISNFISITKDHNGKIRIRYDSNNEANIYKLLKEKGFSKTKIENKRVYYRRINNDIVPVRLFDIKDAFFRCLNDLEFTNIPDILYCDILNWFHRKNPIKQNKLDIQIESPLTPDEVHIYKLKSDTDYKHKMEVEQMLLFLHNNRFGKCIDEEGSILRDAILYYKKIKDSQYLIFAHLTMTRKKGKMDLMLIL